MNNLNFFSSPREYDLKISNIENGSFEDKEITKLTKLVASPSWSHQFLNTLRGKMSDINISGNNSILNSTENSGYFYLAQQKLSGKSTLDSEIEKILPTIDGNLFFLNNSYLFLSRTYNDSHNNYKYIIPKGFAFVGYIYETGSGGFYNILYKRFTDSDRISNSFNDYFHNNSLSTNGITNTERILINSDTAQTGNWSLKLAGMIYRDGSGDYQETALDDPVSSRNNTYPINNLGIENNRPQEIWLQKGQVINNIEGTLIEYDF